MEPHFEVFAVVYYGVLALLGMFPFFPAVAAFLFGKSALAKQLFAAGAIALAVAAVSCTAVVLVMHFVGQGESGEWSGLGTLGLAIVSAGFLGAIAYAVTVVRLCFPKR